MAHIIFNNPFFTVEPRKKNPRHGFYCSRAWRKIRQIIFLRDQSFCKYCAQVNKPVAGQIIDHYLPLRIFPALALDESNLFVCCAECHWKKSKAEFNYPRTGDFSLWLASQGFAKPRV